MPNNDNSYKKFTERQEGGGSKNISIRCPDCSNKVPKDLTQLLLNGTDIFCEVCGFHFTGISQEGEVKPLSEKFKNNKEKLDSTKKYQYKEKGKYYAQKPSVNTSKGKSGEAEPSPSLSKQESEWVRWKQEWNKFKNNWKSSMEDWKKTFQTKKEKEREKQELPPGIYTPRVPYNPPVVTNNPQRMGSPYHRHMEREIDQKKNALFFLITFAPIFDFIMIMVSIGLFFGGIFIGSLSFLRMLGILIFQGFFVHVDINEFLSKEKQGEIPQKGLPLIILGAFGLAANGIGAIMLVRGIVYLNIYISSTKSWREANFIGKLNKKQREDWNGKYWSRELLIAFIPYSSRFFISYYLMTLFISISSIFGPGIAYMVVSIVLSSLSLGLYLGIVHPELEDNYYNLERISENKAIFCIILGFFSLSNSMGLPLLFIGITLIVFLENSKKNLPPLPPMPTSVSEPETHYQMSKSLHSKFEQKKKGKNSPSEQSKETKNSEKEDFILIPTGKRGDGMDGGKPETPKKYQRQGKNISERKFDPITGMPRRFDPQTGEPLNKGENMYKDSVEPPEDEQEGNDLKRIYTVLTPTIREKFLHLEVEPTQKMEIGKSFIYMDEGQQHKYLDELLTLNDSEEEEKYDKLVQRISSLPLKRGRHDFLIRQLNYLPLEEQEEYVQFLEEQVKGNA